MKVQNVCKFTVSYTNIMCTVTLRAVYTRVVYAVVNSLQRQKLRKSFSRRWRSWNITFHPTNATRAGQAHFTLSDTPYAVSNRSKVRNAEHAEKWIYAVFMCGKHFQLLLNLFQPMKSTTRCSWSMTVSPQVWMCPHTLLKKSTVLPQNTHSRMP